MCIRYHKQRCFLLYNVNMLSNNIWRVLDDQILEPYWFFALTKRNLIKLIETSFISVNFFIVVPCSCIVAICSCSPRRVSRKLYVDCVWDGSLYAAVTRTLCIENLLLRARFVVTPAPGIKLCAIAAFRLFHSHAQVLTFTDSTR